MSVKTKFQDFEITEFDILDSTQEEARRLIKNNTAKDLQVITSVTQTAGKGRQGREWISDEGNLFFSLITAGSNYKLPQHAAFAIPLAVSNVVGSPAKIKWPNDVVIENKKLAGILIEKFGNHIIIGVGVNNNSNPEFLDKDRKACRLSDIRKITNEDLLKGILAEYKKIITEYNKNGFEIIRKNYLQKLYKLNEEVEMDYLGKQVKGVVQDINEAGELILKTTFGTEIFKTGEIFDL